jgi:hypothetical protein
VGFEDLAGGEEFFAQDRVGDIVQRGVVVED